MSAPEYRGKISPLVKRSPVWTFRIAPYRKAFLRLDEALRRAGVCHREKDSRIAVEKMRRLRTVLFGCAPE